MSEKITFVLNGAETTVAWTLQCCWRELRGFVTSPHNALGYLTCGTECGHHANPQELQNTPQKGGRGRGDHMSVSPKQELQPITIPGVSGSAVRFLHPRSIMELLWLVGSYPNSTLVEMELPLKTSVPLYRLRTHPRRGLNGTEADAR